MAAALKVMKVAFLALNKAVKANPIIAIIGAIVIVVGALIAVILRLKRNWDYFSTYAQQALAAVEFAARWVVSQIQERFTTVINSLRVLFFRFAETVINAVFGRIASALEGFGGVISLVFPTAGAAIQSMGATVRGLSDGFSRMADEAISSSQATIDAVREEQREMREAHRERLDNINEESRARRAAIRALERYNEEAIEAQAAVANQEFDFTMYVATAYETANQKIEKSLMERLRLIEYTQTQEHNNRINTIASFLVSRARLESDSEEERLAFLKKKQEYLLEMESLSADERLAVEHAVQKAIQQLQAETAKNAEEAAGNMLQSYKVFFGGLSSLLGSAGKENRAFFVMSRKMALVQAGINTYLATTKALSTGGPIKAAGVFMQGMAKKAKIASSMIPSAETGGRFIVPPSRGVDNSIMRVNPGETVDITPRGQAGSGGMAQYIFKIGEQVVFDIVNKGGRSGDINVFEPMGNL